MVGDYVPVLVMVATATGIALVVLALSLFVGPRRPNPRKLMPYESGIEPIDTVRRRFPLRFYLIAMIFIVFDVEAVFFYPWAVIFRRLDVYGALVMAVFVVVLVVGYLYIWRKGAFQWE